jgi:hypothetical protein
MAGGKAGDLTLAVTLFILRTDTIRITKSAHRNVPERILLR